VDELVDDAVGCRLSKDAEPEAFARCVRSICDLPQSEYERMCERARERVARLDWANVMAMMIEAYESLLQEKGEAKLVAGEREAGLRRTISLMPPGEVRDLIAAKISSLEKTIHDKVKPETDKLTSGIKRMQRVPSSSWFVFLLTIPISLLGYVAARYWASTRRLKRARKRHQRRRWMDSDTVSAN